MSLFFETIKVKNGQAYNLSYHQKRVDKTRAAFGFKRRLLLQEHIKDLPKSGFYRLKIEYADEIKKLTCTPYTPKQFNSFVLVNANISYEYKYANREEINSLLSSSADDIIIVKKGLLRDTSIANIALKLEGKWFTPQKPLLEGTARARFLQEGWLEKRELSTQDLKKAENFAIMNALLGWKEIKNIEIKDDFELGFNFFI